MKHQTLTITHSDMIDALQMYVDTIRKDKVIVTDLKATLLPCDTTLYNIEMVSAQEHFKRILKEGKEK